MPNAGYVRTQPYASPFPTECRTLRGGVYDIFQASAVAQAIYRRCDGGLVSAGTTNPPAGAPDKNPLPAVQRRGKSVARTSKVRAEGAISSYRSCRRLPSERNWYGSCRRLPSERNWYGSCRRLPSERNWYGSCRHLRQERQ